MKNYYLLTFLFLSLTSCSIDNEEFNSMSDPSAALNVFLETSVCEPYIRNFENNFGSIEVTNDHDNFYITVVAPDGYDLSDAKLQVEDDYEGFPTVGNGNLPPGQMEYQKAFSTAVDQYTFVVPINGEDCVLIASYSTFSGFGNSFSSWVGNQKGNKGEWLYFEYCVRECSPSPCNNFIGAAGPDKSGTITYTEADALGSLWEVQDVFTNLIEVPIDDNQLNDFSKFNPSIKALVNEFNSLEGQNFGSYQLTTMFTYTEGECSDEVELSITIIDNRNI